MKLISMTIENFRNITSASFSFSHINTFIGNNAQGKTNLMEAISMCLGNPFRKNAVTDITPNGTALKTTLTLKFSTDEYPERENEIKYEINGGKINYKINGIDIKKAKKLYQSLKYVIFIPDDLFLIKGMPDLRRDYIDAVANAMNKIHHERVNEYRRALKQKNTFLSQLPDVLNDSLKIQLEIWNENLARLGVNVMCGRIKYFNTLSVIVNKYYKELNNNNENLTLKYESSIMDGDFSENDVEKMLSTYLEKLTAAIPKELVLRHTMVGVHRDDISFYINGQNAKSFASQGQIRSIALSLRLAEAEMLKEKWQDDPIVILDDVLSELDEYRRNYILQHNVKMQTFITGCNINDFKEITTATRWNVSNGTFTEIRS